MNDNVINFPERKQQRTAIEDDAIIEEAGEVSHIIIDVIISMLEKHGCKFENHDNILPHILLLFESIRSLYLLSKDANHPLQMVAEEFFSYDVS